MSLRRVLIFTRFERFWHWTQMALIITMLVTGFAIHGIHEQMDFDTAVTAHTIAALTLLCLWILATFWLLTTGNWKHYMPTADGLGKVIRFYSYGIFLGERHPYRKAFWRKHNLLQAVAYLALKTDRRDISDAEWEGWLKAWRGFAVHVHYRHPGLACYVAYAIGIARDDQVLMDLAFGSISSNNEDNDELLGIVRDIDRLVVFMKAATSKNRTDPIMRAQLRTRGIMI